MTLTTIIISKDPVEADPLVENKTNYIHIEVKPAYSIVTDYTGAFRFFDTKKEALLYAGDLVESTWE